MLPSPRSRAVPLCGSSVISVGWPRQAYKGKITRGVPAAVGLGAAGLVALANDN
jgi:hypothetical protein